ncbi:hypothetical protein AAVH_43415, partial [Aphelenchoides avenae]
RHFKSEGEDVVSDHAARDVHQQSQQYAAEQQQRLCFERIAAMLLNRSALPVQQDVGLAQQRPQSAGTEEAPASSSSTCSTESGVCKMEPTEAISGPTVPSDCSVIDLIARGATIASTLKRVAEVSTAGSEVIPAKRSRSEDVSDAGASLEALQRDVLQTQKRCFEDLGSLIDEIRSEVLPQALLALKKYNGTCGTSNGCGSVE